MSIIKNSAIYTGAIILQGVGTAILLPLYSHYLSPREYGIVSVINALVNLLSYIYLLSLHGAATRFYVEYQADETVTRQLFGTIFVFIFISNICFTIFLIASRKFLLENLLTDIAFYPYILLGLLAVTFYSTYPLFQAILQVKQMSMRFAVHTIAYVIVNMLLAVFFVVLAKMQAVGVLLALTITNILFFFYFVVIFVRKLVLKPNQKLLVKSLRYAIPLVPHAVAAWAIILINHLLINTIISSEAVALYDIGFYASSVVYIVSLAVNQAYTPWFYAKMNGKPKEKIKIAQVAEFACVCYALLALAISFVAFPVLSILFAPQYQLSYTVVPFLSFSFVFGGLYYFFSSPLFFNTKYTKLVPFCTLISASINIILNLLLIPRYGIIGSAIGTLIAMVCVSFVALQFAYRFERLPFQWRKMYLIALGFFIISLMALYETDSNFILLIVVKTLVLGVCTWVVYRLYQGQFAVLYRYARNRFLG